MQVENHKEGVPFEYYENLFKNLDPQDAASRTGLNFDGKAFTVPLAEAVYTIFWPEYAISADREDAFALKSLPTQTFMLRYLLEGKAVESKGSFKTFREKDSMSRWLVG